MHKWTVLATVWLFAGCSYLGEPDGTYQNRVDETADYIYIHSPAAEASTGFLFYPGGLVDAGVYKTWCDGLVTVRPDVSVLIVKMPLNLAVFSPEKGIKYMERQPQIHRWLAGGHSLGGTMAARLVHQRPGAFRGLVLLGSYPAASDDLSEWPGFVLSLSAQYDGLSTPEKIEDNQKLLPPPYAMLTPTDQPPASMPYTGYYRIPGGNHAGFGSYGPQKGDGQAGISPEAQHQVMITAIDKFIQILWP